MGAGIEAEDADRDGSAEEGEEGRVLEKRKSLVMSFTLIPRSTVEGEVVDDVEAEVEEEIV